MNTKKHVLAVILAAAVGTASAQTASAPDPQSALSAAATQNTTSAYGAGVAYYDQQAYQAAANTAQGISNQDAANAGGSALGGDVWQQAADQAQSVANDNQTQADSRIPILQQDQASEASAYSTEVNAAPAVAQSNSDSAQASASSGAANSLSGISAQTGVQTGVQTGQVTPHDDTSYLAAGAATQALMNNLSTTGFEANKTAVQDAQNAASCGNPYCAAAWWAANAVEQNMANSAYAGNVAAAPVLGGALNAAAAASAVSNAAHSLQQIQSMTGVPQGQTAGATSTNDALQQITAQTGVQTGQSATAANAGTVYTSAADAQQASLNAASQQNENDAVTAAQAWQAGLSAQYSENAADTISQYDTSMAGKTGDPTWTQAAAIAQQSADQQRSVYDAQQAVQTSATTDGNATYSAATAAAPAIGNTLNTAASTAAATDASSTLQQIGAATGVPQNGQ